MTWPPTSANIGGAEPCPHCTPHRLLLLALDDPCIQIWTRPEAAADVLGIARRTLERMAATGKVPKRGSLYDLGAAHRARTPRPRRA